MNKFAAIALLAFVAVAAANNVQEVKLIDLEDPETQLALVPSDEEETAGLVGDATIFHDFCIKSRDFVLGDIKHQTNTLAATIFSMFFKNAEQIGQSAIDASREANSKLSQQIRNPDAAIAEPEEGNQVAAIIADGQQKIQQAQVQPQSFFQAVIANVGAAANAVSSGVVNSLKNLSGALGMNRVVGAMSNVCNQFAHYEEQNKAAFAQFIESIAAKDPALASIPYENVKCLTTKRISKLDGICKFSAVAKGPASQIFKSMS